MARQMASYFFSKSDPVMSSPTLTLVLKVTPSSVIKSIRRCTICLDSFMVGMPYWRRPPIRSCRSKTVTKWPALLSWSAQARPAGPEPMIATLRPERIFGLCAFIQPFSYACSMIDTSIVLIATGGSLIPKVHAPSHGAGHTRPVNSGKLFVCNNCFIASYQSSW